MFHSFQDREHEVENNWRRHGDPKDTCIGRLHNQLNVVNNIIRSAFEERCEESENFSDLTGFYGSRDHLVDHEKFVWRQPEATTNVQKSCGTDRLKHQLNVVNNTIRRACGGGHDTNITRDTYNFGLANNSYFSWYNHCSMSQHDSRSTLFSETYDSSLPLQLSNDESICEDFMDKQRKQNEEILGKLNSLSSKFKTRITQLEKMLETIIVQETCSSYRSQDEQNDKMTLQSNEELESFSSLKEIANCYETNSDDDTQFETNEEQEKIEKSKVVAPPPIIIPIFIPLRLTYIEKSNELELKDPPIASIIDEFEKKENGGNPLKVEASDVTKEMITKIDLSSQLEKCLKNRDVMEGNKPQIKYHIPIERWKMTSKQGSTKHISRVFLKYFWVNYDALNGRKVKIR